jgi:hypothetical protein
MTRFPSKSRGAVQLRLVLVGVAALLLAGGAVVLLDPGFGGRHWVAVDQPPAEPLSASAGEEVDLAGRAARSDDCLVGSAGQDAAIVNDRFGGAFIVEEGASEQIVWLDVTCDGVVRERFAREVVAPPGRGSDRADVARVHLDTERLQDAISARLPGMVNPILQSWVDEQIHAQVLKPGATIEVRSGRIQLEEDRLSVQITVDLDLHLTDWGGLVHLKSRGLEFAGTVVLHDSGRISVRNVGLQGSLCDAYREMGVVGLFTGPACHFLQWSFQPDVEEAIEDALSGKAETWRQSIDRRKLVGGAIVEWAERMNIGARLAHRLEGAEFDVRRGESGARGALSFTVVANREWLDREPGAEQLEMEDTAAPVDVAISAALVNKMLDIVFDRPVSRVVTDLDALGRALGFEVAADSVVRQLEALEDGDAQHEPGSLGSFLDAVYIAYDADGVLQPRLQIRGDDELSVYTAHSRILETTLLGEELAIGLSAEGRVTVRTAGDRTTLKIDRSWLFDHLTLEPVPDAGASVAEETRVRYAELARLARAELAGGGSGPGWDALYRVLDTVHKLPAHFQLGSMEVDVDRVGVQAAGQAITFSGTIETVEH